MSTTNKQKRLPSISKNELCELLELADLNELETELIGRHYGFLPRNYKLQHNPTHGEKKRAWNRAWRKLEHARKKFKDTG